MLKEIAGWAKRTLLLDEQVKSLKETMKAQAQQLETLTRQHHTFEVQLQALAQRVQTECAELQGQARLLHDRLQKLSDEALRLGHQMATLASDAQTSRADNKDLLRDTRHLSAALLTVTERLNHWAKEQALIRQNILQEVELLLLTAQPASRHQDTCAPSPSIHPELSQLLPARDSQATLPGFIEN